jgi:predicted DsbA family dithiol-disulfide isomerase
MCAWSYASEPTIQSLISEYKDKVEFQFRSLPILDRIVGAPRTGEKFHSPEEIESIWTNVSKKMNEKIDTSIWRENPPHSSWPANRAMKAAFRQGFDKGNRYTHLLRDAVMVDKQNISNFEVLKSVADKAALDVEQFHSDMTRNATQLEQEVSADRFSAIDRCIESTPTIYMENDDGDKVIVSGVLDYAVCSRAIRSLMGERVIGAPEVEIAPSI